MIFGPGIIICGGHLYVGSSCVPQGTIPLHGMLPHGHVPCDSFLEGRGQPWVAETLETAQMVRALVLSYVTRTERATGAADLCRSKQNAAGR